MEKAGLPATHGLQRAWQTRWKSSPTALDVALIASSLPTQPPSLQLNSGDAALLKSSAAPFLQGLWLEKPELEPVLQPDSLLTGEMATCHQLNLWEHHNRIHQWTARAHETVVPNRETAKSWATFFSHRGDNHVLCHISQTSMFIKPCHIWRGPNSTTPTKKTLL